MNVPHVAVVAVIGAVALTACSDDSETILALNVQAGEADRSVDQIQVTIAEQGGFQKTFVPPTEVTDIEDPNAPVAAGGAPTIQVQLLQAPFWERIKLGDSWETGKATVTVTALYQGTPTVSDTVSIKLRAEESTAVYVDLSGEEPPAPTGAGGAGGAAAGETGGTETGGTAAATGGAGGA